MSLQPYPGFKDSGVDWLRSLVPTAWVAVKVGYLAKLQSGTAIDGDLVRDAGRYPVYGGGGFRGYTDTFTNQGSHVLVGRQGALCGNVRVAEGPFFATEHSLVAYPLIDLDVRWLAYNFEVMNLGQYSQSAAQPGLSAEVLQSKHTILPPVGEQSAIAEYLDREAAEIDAFIADEEELIILLTERRSATISHAVTKGIDPSATMKESGIAWLGRIPAEWEVLSGRRLFDQRKELASVGDEQLAATQEYGVIPQAAYTERSGYRVVEVLKGFEILKRVRPGDFVISMRSFQGGLEYSEYFGKISSAYVMLVPSRALNDAYFRYLFKCSAYISALRSTSNLVRDGQAMRYSNFAQVQIPIPSLDDQALIAGRLDRESAEIDAAISDAREAIELSKERRSALISAAVTGKIDVRNHGGVE